MNSLAPKKPVSSVDIDERMAEDRVSVLLDQVDAVRDPDRREVLEEELRTASTHLRTFWRPRKTWSNGQSIWPAIGFAVGCAALLIFGVFRITRAPDLWHILERVSDYNQTLQQIHDGHPQTPVVMHWCPGNPQPFEPGQTLIDLGLEFHADSYCYTTTKYSLLRDAATCPVVPKNCAHTNCADPQSDHIVCEGKPQFD